MQQQDFNDAENEYSISRQKALRAIDSVASTAAGQKQGAVATAQNELRECDEAIREMASIAYKVAPTQKKAMNERIKQYRFVSRL